eukprot:TRINITY_DN3764_c0_g1_i1.p1 TRINITY_DN3764_c0_g1~~TRINITY_DN3764_c0_g1_i1.p1  ORF type:complete len:774 (+),score=134.76 TRINITY_DN3764_c0_g1_i1:240-2324(+)
MAMKHLGEENFAVAFDLLKKADHMTQNVGVIGNDKSRLRLRAVTMNNYGCYYKRAGKPLTALSYVDEALKIEVLGGVADSPATTHLNMCAILQNLDRHQAAMQHAQCALRLLVDGDRSAQDDPTLLPIAYHALGKTQQALKLRGDALKAHQDALRIMLEQGASDDPLTESIRSSIDSLQKAMTKKKTKKKGTGKKAKTKPGRLLSNTAKASIAAQQYLKSVTRPPLPPWESSTSAVAQRPRLQTAAPDIQHAAAILPASALIEMGRRSQQASASPKRTLDNSVSMLRDVYGPSSTHTPRTRQERPQSGGARLQSTFASAQQSQHHSEFQQMYQPSQHYQQPAMRPASARAEYVPAVPPVAGTMRRPQRRVPDAQSQPAAALSEPLQTHEQILADFSASHGAVAKQPPAPSSRSQYTFSYAFPPSDGIAPPSASIGQSRRPTSALPSQRVPGALHTQEEADNLAASRRRPPSAPISRSPLAAGQIGALGNSHLATTLDSPHMYNPVQFQMPAQLPDGMSQHTAYRLAGKYNPLEGSHAVSHGMGMDDTRTSRLMGTKGSLRLNMENHVESSALIADSRRIRMREEPFSDSTVTDSDTLPAKHRYTPTAIVAPNRIPMGQFNSDGYAPHQPQPQAQSQQNQSPYARIDFSPRGQLSLRDLSSSPHIFEDTLTPSPATHGTAVSDDVSPLPVGYVKC